LRAIEHMAACLAGREIEELMADWGTTSRQVTNHPQLRWLGPHKGVVGLAMAAISNACFDLWAKSRGVPVWRLLLDLEVEAFLDLLDLSYLEDALTREEARIILEEARRTRDACGEHISNRILFKNFLQAGGMQVCQVDATRVAGVDEFLAVSLLARKFGVSVVPHVGDMGQIHQHLVLVNHIAMGHDALFLEYIPHLRDHFVHPATVADGVYRIPQEPGMSCDLKDY